MLTSIGTVEFDDAGCSPLDASVVAQAALSVPIKICRKGCSQCLSVLICSRSLEKEEEEDQQQYARRSPPPWGLWDLPYPTWTWNFPSSHTPELAVMNPLTSTTESKLSIITAGKFLSSQSLSTSSRLIIPLLLWPHCIATAVCRLEDPDAPETKEFVAQQVELTNTVLANCDNREILKKKVTSLYNYPRYGCPYRHGKHFFFRHNPGLQSQNILYIQVQPPSFPSRRRCVMIRNGIGRL